MKLPENDTKPDDELADAVDALAGTLTAGPSAVPPLELALRLERAMGAYALVHPTAGGGRSGRLSKNADTPAARYLAEHTGLEVKYIRRVAGFPAKLHHDLLLRLRSFRRGVTVTLLREVTRMPAEEQAKLAGHLRTVAPGTSAADATKLWQRGLLAGSTDIAADEIDFMNALMVGLQRAYKERIYVERRNVGTVVTRDRAGQRTGVFHASRVVGAADITGAIAPHGQRFEVETKMADGELSDEQRVFRDRMLGLGVVHVVIAYDDGLDLEKNVERGVGLFDQALGNLDAGEGAA